MFGYGTGDGERDGGAWCAACGSDLGVYLFIRRIFTEIARRYVRAVFFSNIVGAGEACLVMQMMIG